jgi:hypothetical protein
MRLRALLGCVVGSALLVLLGLSLHGSMGGVLRFIGYGIAGVAGLIYSTSLRERRRRRSRPDSSDDFGAPGP